MRRYNKKKENNGKSKNMHEGREEHLQKRHEK